MKMMTYFWKGFCFRCFRTFEYPLLGDFSYGEDIFQTVDGQGFYRAVMIDNEVTNLVGTVLNGQEYYLESIMPQLADKPNSIPFSLKPICPKCRKRLWSIPSDNNEPGSKRLLGFVTWNDFLKKSKEEKEELIKDAYAKSR